MERDNQGIPEKQKVELVKKKHYGQGKQEKKTTYRWEKMRLAFVWNYEARPQDLLYWWDGLRAALDYLEIDFGYEILRLTAQSINEIESFKPDFILSWGSLDQFFHRIIRNYGVKTGLCYAGGSKENLDNFDVIFYESQIDGDEFEILKSEKNYKIHLQRAFGTNDELFRPFHQKKIWDAIYPATFARWKRHELFARAVGDGGLACGNWLEYEMDCVNVCKKYGVLTLKAVHPEVLVSLYNASFCTLLTADRWGGCQRAVLESLSCNVPVIVCSDNKRSSEFIEESGEGLVVDPDIDEIKEAITKIKEFKCNGRKYIEANWTAKHYAKALDNGIKAVL